MVLNFNRKIVLSLVVLSSIALISAAYIFQHFMGLQPCFLCIVQRIAVILIGFSALVLLIKEFKFPLLKWLGYLLYFTSSSMGLFAAFRQMYLQRFPDPYVSCGPGFEYVLENSPLVQAIPKLFLATGNCSEVDWSFIGLSMAEWMIPIFIAYISIGLYLLFKNTKKAV